MISDEMVEAAAEAVWQSEPARIGSRRLTLWLDEGDEMRSRYRSLARAALETALPMIRAKALEGGAGQFRIGDRVTKIKGSQWTGRIVGFYSTTLTPEGYAVESETEIGSVQIYPAAAISALKDTP